MPFVPGIAMTNAVSRSHELPPQLWDEQTLLRLFLLHTLGAGTTVAPSL